jgi:hypothetical protein
LKERYEVLRSQSLGYLPGRAERELFMNQGMATWIKAWRNYSPEGSKSTEQQPLAGQSSMPIQADVVMILASMLMSCGKQAKM